MVHAKKKSGDPDFDDKVPLRDQLGEVVEGPNGEPVRVTESVGPVNADGSHAALDAAAEDDDRPDARNADVPKGLETIDPDERAPHPATFETPKVTSKSK